MGCSWWNHPTQYKEDCYWYREEQDMNAHIPYCTCKNQFPLNTCENCEDYHSRSKRTQGDRIRAMTDEELAEFIVRCIEADFFRVNVLGTHSSSAEEWLDWLRQEADDDKLSKLRSAD